MFCEDQIMSVDDATVEKGAGSLNSSGSSISIDAKPLLSSWAQEVIRAELGNSDEASTSLNSSAGSTTGQNQQSVFVKNEQIEVSQKETLIKREISFEFLDGVNEEKFDRLVKEEKLKTPFKRRHSQTPPSNENSRSNSPNNSSLSANEANDNAKPSQKPQFKAHKEEKRVRHNSNNSSNSSSSSAYETDPAVLSRRQKQIDYGKNTAAYERYTEAVPKTDRTRDHPRTPNIYGKYSRRAFDGLVKIWRKQLHVYDPPTASATERGASSDSDSD
ncbi:histone RNA hairpin-binding protein [Scaptodrosophila lebanonensis]|uniref:Histone RNA hairpin-binding protein n=1 Tax=Drosophila lebanonensis TaxID=7225 RepID=A0A6J2T6D6_DROLE|nr:histone RNA hairpin-binding protein [Scaptodrosophila lebanonensis]